MWAPVGSSASGQEVHECSRFVLESEPEERVDAERSVPDPYVAIVPVPFPSDLFRKARGGRGNDRPGRGVCQELERQRGPLNDCTQTAPKARGGEPVPPEVHRRHQLVERLLLLADPELGRSADLLQGKDGNPALAKGELSDRVALVDRQGLGGTEIERYLGRGEEHAILNRRDGMG